MDIMVINLVCPICNNKLGKREKFIIKYGAAGLLVIIHETDDSRGNCGFYYND